jgi:hypothetical protein
MSVQQEENALVADLVNQLFDLRRHPSGREFTNREVGLALRRRQTNPAVHIQRIRTNKIKNPTRETLLALCVFFEVEPSYFFPELRAMGVAFKPMPDSYARQNSPA